MNCWLAGLFAFAALHYAIQWWFSRSERVLLVFSILCAIYAAFSLSYASFFQATTIFDVQTAQDRVITFGMLGHVLVLHVYGYAGGRRDLAFRTVATGAMLVLVVLNQWVPLRGTVIAVESITLPGGEMVMLPVRTSPGTSLVLLYLVVLVNQIYGFFVARTLWRDDRSGAVLIAISATALLAGFAIGLLVDFAGAKVPYAGALPIVVFVLAMAVFLSREYSARAARILASERRFEAAFEHAPIGKALLAPDGQFLRVNRALCGILGASAEEICARRLQDIVRNDDDGSIEADTRRLLAGETGAFALERHVVRKDGNLAWARLAVSVVPDDSEQSVQLMAQIEDVTELRAHRERLEELVATRTLELREATDEAERASQAKSRFLAHMSHEIRNPLHAIVLNAHLIELDVGLDAAQRKRVESIQRSGEHLETLINDVLEMSRIEAGRLELVTGPFDLAVALEEVAQMFTSQAASRGTGLTIEFGPGLQRSLLGDGGKVKQVLINLVSNAVKFTQWGSIRITVTQSPVADLHEGTLVQIDVVDTGIGIEAHDLARMFRPFEQLEDGARVGGTGLGLAISLAHARLLGGDIRVASTPALGSTFTFTFVAQRAGLETARNASGQHRHTEAAVVRHKVLVVDDEQDNRDVLAELLAELGFEARTAADGPAALATHADWGPDIVLMDLRMPGMNGLDAIRQLRAAGSRAAIGALTAGAYGNDEHHALDVGADFFIRKPYHGRDLLDKVGRVLEARVILPPGNGGLVATQG